MPDQTNYYLETDFLVIKNMNHNEYIDFYNGLMNVIKYHNDLYYNQNQIMITDAEYDKLFNKLLYCENVYHEYINKESPTQTLSDQLDIQTEFIKALHESPLLSLQKAYNENDLLNWDESNTKSLIKMGIDLYKSDYLSENLNINDIYNIKYIIEPKYDGISIELIYIDGFFTQAITRGDGVFGEDITANVKTIKNLPKKLIGNPKGKMRFRGEILMTKSEFERINQERSKNGEPQFANPRNAASGTAKQLDRNITANRNLMCFVYEEL